VLSCACSPRGAGAIKIKKPRQSVEPRLSIRRRSLYISGVRRTSPRGEQSESIIRGNMNQVEAPKATRPSLRPLRKLAPYILRYRALAAGALAFLLLAAATTLSLPLAVRQ